MEKLVLKGGIPLRGEVSISGAKNSAVAVIPAAILVDGPCSIENIPDINDVKTLIGILKELGSKVSYGEEGAICINSQYVTSNVATYDMIKSLRGSYYLLGALLGRFKKAEVALPGGCDFGFRPIDQHIKGFQALGANVEINHGIVKLEASKLVGTQIYMDVVSVGATVNIMLAAIKAEGTTTIENAAKEPHVVDVANFLNAMGANVKGAGTDVIKIKGVSNLSGGAVHSIIPDQIEAGTFMIAAAATKGEVLVKNIIPKHMESLSAKLIEMNVGVEEGGDWIRINGTSNIRKANIKTLPYPGFPTDLQPPICVMLCLAKGTSTISEGVWESRFQYVDELKRMGASIRVEGRMAVVEGVSKLSSAPVEALDLRAGAAMVIAGLVAEGETEVYNTCYISRGYEKLEHKLEALGAKIKKIKG
ncbi:UDP-N-acetylglucosamine 1-carboxyvinyltransferase [Herbivorax sp. ANBcel31]|uniref:UDP-N-acetylglucosamine 1-carboxyvinyltransferase n=1 Tax=Herbivorax sp. ANBcel31 TaxID=3069754 RepID=UPI0027AFF03E|nr:UDP-N-acetylglucosamine 1-carboxyvinyltransferase [Herbivorax sp. ANBcel31]MDQ2087496.1 UDP-N-acetylglucosamine 1-carboxyvinyltransferase [Herbivorax sp. ANBcel31]